MCTFFSIFQKKDTHKFRDSVAIYRQKKKSYEFVNDKM